MSPATRMSAFAQSRGCEACAKRGNCTLEDALLAVRDDAKRQAIPLRYFQWDDWASLNPTAWPPRAFPDGATHWLGNDPFALNASAPFALALYNGEWSSENGSVSRATGRAYAFRCAAGFEGELSAGCIATDSSFFIDVFANGTTAGMSMFEQDYICSTTAATSRALGVGRAWFAALESGARRAAVDVQLCMMNPAHALASTLMASASNGRGTGDHVVRNAQRGLALGPSSILLNAVGLWPSRDNVWTNSTTNVSGIPTEPGPLAQSTLALLAGGPYGPADIAGAMNKSLVLRACRADGVLLRPSIPALPLQATLVGHHFAATVRSPPPPHVWRAASELNLLGARAADGSDAYVATYASVCAFVHFFCFLQIMFAHRGIPTVFFCLLLFFCLQCSRSTSTRASASRLVRRARWATSHLIRSPHSPTSPA